MDRVVQSAIRTVLESIYEPWFERRNRSFGFRPNKGVHDAIYSIIRKENRGLYMAIEGDVKGAYDNVCRETLLEILGKRIKDKKFLGLMKNRLNYIFFDTIKNKYTEEKDGIPEELIVHIYGIYTATNLMNGSIITWIHYSAN